jgi:hypothetical protein
LHFYFLIVCSLWFVVGVGRRVGEVVDLCDPPNLRGFFWHFAGGGGHGAKRDGVRFYANVCSNSSPTNVL